MEVINYNNSATDTKPKLYILTTAITRNTTHIKSLGVFYKSQSISLLSELYDIIHIIHVDFPLELRETGLFSLERTKHILSHIVPLYVELIIVDGPNEFPSFGNAYGVLLSTVNKYNLKEERGDIIWWMEDDWEPIINYNYANVIYNLFNSPDMYLYPTAISLTNNSPLCSFRGGPIMNIIFFKRFFDIFKQKHNLGIDKEELNTIHNNMFNPEEKVSRNIRMNRSVSEYNGHIYSICIYILSETNYPYTLRDHHPWYYKKKYKSITKFKHPYGIRYISAFMDEPDSMNIRHTSVFEDAYDIQPINNINDIQLLKVSSIQQFHTEIICSSAIKYITVLPYIFVDIGREFNKQHSVISFSSKND
jgi:hypothetical protein